MNIQPNRQTEKLHVFYVQSPISTLMCEAIVKHRELAPEDVLFVLDRGTSAPGRLPSVVAPNALARKPSKSLRNIPRTRVQRGVARRFIQDATRGRPFDLYINKMSQPAYDLFRRAPRFVQAHLYEEGFASYHLSLVRRQDLAMPRAQWRTAAIWAIGGYSMPPPGGFYLDEYGSVFCSSDEAFANFPRRVVLDLLPTVRRKTTDADLRQIPQGAVIFAMPQLFVFREDPKMSRKLEDVLVWCLTAADRPALFKLHPTREAFEPYLDQLAQRVQERAGVDFRDYLAPDLSLEVVGQYRGDILLLIGISSIAVYARFFQARVVSVAEFIYGPDYHLLPKLVRVSPQTTFVRNLHEIAPLICTPQSTQR